MLATAAAPKGLLEEGDPKVGGFVLVGAIPAGGGGIS